MKDKKDNDIGISADTDTSMVGDVTGASDAGNDKVSNHKSSSDATTLATAKIEWDSDMEYSLTEAIGGGKKRAYKIKGRCRKCWGKLIGRTNEKHVYTGIKCRVCGIMLEGNDAGEEGERMFKESGVNTFNMVFGHNPKYADGLFVEKIFPCIDRQTEVEIKKRVNAKVKEGNKEGKLTRNSFPLGSAGLLVMQATILMAGVKEISNPYEMSVASFPDFDVKDDGSLVAHLPMEELKKDPQYLENRMMEMMGSTMTQAMISAFACELTMKAICLTCKDEALKSHDLLELYDDLPESSRRRTEADFVEIREVIDKGKQIFGSWRYFEKNAGEEAIRMMIDLEQAQALGKVARVILDEAEMVGLGGSVKMDVEKNVRITGEIKNYKQKITVNIKGQETPP